MLLLLKLPMSKITKAKECVRRLIRDFFPDWLSYNSSSYQIVVIGIGFTRPHSCFWSPIWYVRHTSRQTAWIRQQRGTYSPFFRSLVCSKIKSDHHRELFSYRTDPFSPCINASMLMGFKLDVTPVMVTTGAARSNITWFQKPFSMEACVPLSFDELVALRTNVGEWGMKIRGLRKTMSISPTILLPVTEAVRSTTIIMLMLSKRMKKKILLSGPKSAAPLVHLKNSVLRASSKKREKMASYGCFKKKIWKKK